MKLVLNQPCIEPFEPAKDLKVVVVCEDSTAAGRACAMLERIGRNAGMVGRMIYNWWNFEVLAITVLKKLAASEAAEADLIVIAAHDGSRLPEAVIDWISQWLAIAEHRPRALVALLGSGITRNGNSPDILSKLEKIAEWGQMNFFAGGAGRERETAPAQGPAPSPGRQLDEALIQRSPLKKMRRHNRLGVLNGDVRGDRVAMDFVERAVGKFVAAR
jgi:hypothetical protein